MRLPRNLWGFLSVSVLSVAGFGCSVHPLPDDISRESTYSIVVKIRCEARDQVFQEVQHLLSKSYSPIIRSMDPRKVIENLPFIRKTDPAIAAIIDKYRLSAIAYGFTFTITENNNNDATAADFKLPFKTTTFSLGLNGKADLERKAIRKIDVIELFQELGSLNCGEVSPTGTNIVYPITGSIGMDEIIRSFFSVSESIPLQSSSLSPVSSDGSEGKFIDTLTFTTTLDSTVTPSVKLAPLKPKQFQLVDASGMFESKRVDMHQVVVTLTFPVEPAAPTKAAPTKAAASKAAPDYAPPIKSASASLPAIPGPGQLAPASAQHVANQHVATVAVRKAATPASLRNYSNYPIIRDATKVKAAEELCIQRALQREEQLNITRLDAPELYCQFNYSRY